jgi:hypothetical protein
VSCQPKRSINAVKEMSVLKDWWAEPVKQIYREALSDLGGDDGALDFGPGHIVWSDDNLTDEDVKFCLSWCEPGSPMYDSYIERFGEDGLAVAKRALERLDLIPEDERGDDPQDYDED